MTVWIVLGIIAGCAVLVGAVWFGVVLYASVKVENVVEELREEFRE